jgi:hypothetical protein
VATRYTLDARITGTNESGPAWQSATNDARQFGQALRDIPNEVNVGIDLENVSNDVQELNTRLQEGINDVQVGIDFESVSNDISTLNQRISSGLKDVKVGIDFESVTNDISGLNDRISSGLKDVTVGIDFESVTGDITALNQRISSGLKDVTVGIDFENIADDIAALNARLGATLKDQKVEVDVDYDRGVFSSLTRASSQAASSVENLAQNQNDLGQAVIRSANVIRSSGFLGLLGGIAAAAYAAGPAIQAAGGAAIALGSAGASAGVGVGLLGAALLPTVRRFSDYNEAVKSARTAMNSAEKGSKEYKEAQNDLAKAQKILTDREKDLFDNWKKLSGALASDKGFENANKDVLRLTNTVLEAARRALPALGREAEETGDAFSKAARQVADRWGRTERNSVSRILDNASNSVEDIVKAAGNLGGGIANIIGSPAAVRAARQFTDYLNDITKDFQSWSRTERAREAIADWLQRARTIGRGASEAIAAIARALGRFDDEDAKNVADALRAIGRAAEGSIDLVRQLGRVGSDAFRWVNETWKDLDKLDGELKDTQKTQDNWADAIGKFLRKGSGPGWQFDNWLRNTERHEKFREELRKDRTQAGLWGADMKANTEKAKKDWDTYIGKGVVKGVLKELDDRLKGNSSATNNWKKNQENATQDVQNSWAVKIGREIVQEIIPDFIKEMDRNAENTSDWRKGQQDNTKKSKTAWEYQILGGIVDAAIPKYVKALSNSADKTDKWADRVKDILNGILSWLGMGGGGGNDGVDHQSGSGSSRPQGGSNGGAQGLGRNTGGGGGGGGGGGNDDMVPGGIGLSEGGIAVPGQFAYVGDAKRGEREAVVNMDRYTDASARAMSAAMDTWAEKGWLERLERGKSHVPHVTIGPNGVPGIWGGEGLGPTTHHWRPAVQRYQEETKRAVGGISTNTYKGHPGGEMNSVDHWGPGGRGDHIAKSKGDAVEAHVTSNYPVKYYIWQGKIHGWGNTRPYTDAGDRHFDHIHVTYGGGSGTGVSDGGGGFGPSFSEVMDRIRGAIPELSLGLGPYGEKLSGAITDRVFDAIEGWVQDKIGDLGFGGGSSPGGLTMMEAITAGGFPASKRDTAVGVAWEESGGDAGAKNPSSSAYGLFQFLKSTAQGMGLSYSKMGDPIYASKAANKLSKGGQDWSPWAAYPPSAQSKRMGDQKITGYTNGGFAISPQISAVAERGPEFFMPLHDPLAASRFMDFLERASRERQKRSGPGGDSSGGVGGHDAPLQDRLAQRGDLVRELRERNRDLRDELREMREDLVEQGKGSQRALKAIYKLLREHGIDIRNIDDLGSGTTNFMLDSLRRNPRVKRIVQDALDDHNIKMSDLTGQRG